MLRLFTVFNTFKTIFKPCLINQLYIFIYTGVAIKIQPTLTIGENRSFFEIYKILAWCTNLGAAKIIFTMTVRQIQIYRKSFTKLAGDCLSVKSKTKHSPSVQGSLKIKSKIRVTILHVCGKCWL